MSMAENIMLNRVGACIQPCLTPFVTGNGSENSPSLWTRASIPSWNCLTIAMNLVEQPNFAIIFQRPSRLTVSNALVRSTKVIQRSMLCSWHFSWSCLAMKIMSVVPPSFLYPHWLSGRSPDCSRCSFSRLSRTLARTFPAIDNKEMPRWLAHKWGFPFRLNRWIIDASLNSRRMASFLRIMWNNSVIFFATGVPPAL